MAFAAALPAIISAVAMIGSKFLDKKPSEKSLPTLSEGQLGLQGSIIDQIRSLLGGGEPNLFSDFAAPFQRQFQEETIPGLTNRFAGLGNYSSSSFQNALGQAGAGLQEKLAALRGGLSNQLLGQLLPSAFTQNFATELKPGTANPISEGLAPILQAYGQQAGMNLANWKPSRSNQSGEFSPANQAQSNANYMKALGIG